MYFTYMMYAIYLILESITIECKLIKGTLFSKVLKNAVYEPINITHPPGLIFLDKNRLIN